MTGVQRKACLAHLPEIAPQPPLSKMFRPRGLPTGVTHQTARIPFELPTPKTHRLGPLVHRGAFYGETFVTEGRVKVHEGCLSHRRSITVFDKHPLSMLAYEQIFI